MIIRRVLKGVLYTIKKIEVENFRCLKDFYVSLEEDLTVVVGENDCGKSSLIDVLKIIFENSSPEKEDFYRDTDEININIQMESLTLIKEFKKDEITKPALSVKFEANYLKTIKEEVESIKTNDLSDDEKRNALKTFAKQFGVSVRSNSLVDTIVDNINGKIDELEKNDFIMKVNSFPDFNVYFLDGKQFEDINEFFKQTFFKNKRRKIWSEEIHAGDTLESLVSSQLDTYSTEIEQQIEDQGIREKLKDYLPGLTDVKILPQFEPSDINIGVNVQFLEGDQEVFVKKKGDGTKRRITMALLEYKNITEKDVSSLYVFDEPDTHLHVKAQVELLAIIRKFNETNKQVVITTHSPFIMNAVKPNQIRFLYLEDGKSNIKPIIDDKNIEWILNTLGIANTHLFFSKKILVVEGHTEEIFIPLVYQKIHNKSLRSNLVKIIRGEGIDDVPRLSKVLEDFSDPNNIFLLIDNDGNKKLHELIDELGIPKETNVFEIGYKEFEDTFEAEIIYKAWFEFVELNHGTKVDMESFKEKWTIEKIDELKEECKINHNKKFSEELANFSRDECLVPMKKTELGNALAKIVEKENLDSKITDLFSKINED